MTDRSLFRFVLVMLAVASWSPAQVPALFQAETPWADRWAYAYPLTMDINRDGFLDLVVLGYDSTSNATLATFLNDRGNGWVGSRVHWTNRKYEAHGWPAITELDGDGLLDLIVLRSTRVPWLMPNFPAEGATAVREVDFRLVDSLDWKHIPRPMIQYGQGGHGYLSWDPGWTSRDYEYAFYFHPEFADLVARTLPTQMTRLIQADFNMDGKPDAVALPGYASQDSSLYRRSGSSGYENVGISGFAMWGGSHEVGDYDNDGDLDIVSSGMTSHTAAFGNVNFRAFFENRGDTLAQVGFDRDGPGYGACLLADFDNDGDLDLLSIGKYAPTQIHRNMSTRKNAPPSIPQGLFVETDSGSLRLNWSRAQDDLTRSTGLTYNLRIGTAPDRGDVLLVAADPITGKLLTPHLGNNGTDTVKTLYTSASNYLYPLPAGKYYWTVQAVDNGYSASPFAPVQTFEVVDSGTTHIIAAPLPSPKATRIQWLRPGRQPRSVSLDGRVWP